eukprot:m.1066735 g.1066735  ORF g.1066735 m.1066735 type:complete len:66 (+) comp24220_c0_seq68:3965-4162(+)
MALAGGQESTKNSSQVRQRIVLDGEVEKQAVETPQKTRVKLGQGVVVEVSAEDLLGREAAKAPGN